MAEHDTSFSKTGEESTSKWSDVIKNSEQTATEPIKIYMLNTVKEELSEDGRVRKYTFGRKNPKINNKPILMVGESGTGKSALINMMLNYMLGVKWDDNIRFQIIPDHSESLRTESQTTVITAYEIFGLEDLSVPFSLTVIDTPGYGDTGGIEKDKSIAQNMDTLFKSLVGISQLNATCLVVKASQNRLYPNQKYIFDAILSLFGKNMKKNIMTLITFSNWMLPSNALAAVIESGVPVSKDEDDQPVHFLFDNLPFQKPGEKYKKAHKTGWDNGAESFSEFFQALNKMKNQNLRMTEKVMKDRRKLEASIHSLESQIEEVEMRHGALEDKKKTLEEHREDLRKNHNFQYKYNVVVMKTLYGQMFMLEQT